MIVLLLLSLSVVFGVTGGEVGSPAARNSSENCEASCPDEGERPWPPEGFVEDEIAVRCSLSCLQDEMQVGETSTVITNLILYLLKLLHSNKTTSISVYLQLYYV